MHTHTNTFLTHWLFNSVLLRESIPRQVDKSGGPRGERGSGVLEEEIGVWNSQGGGKDKLIFPLRSLRLYNKNVSCLRIVSEKRKKKKPSGLSCNLTM